MVSKWVAMENPHHRSTVKLGLQSSALEEGSISWSCKHGRKHHRDDKEIVKIGTTLARLHMLHLSDQ